MGVSHASSAAEGPESDPPSGPSTWGASGAESTPASAPIAPDASTLAAASISETLRPASRPAAAPASGVFVRVASRPPPPAPSATPASAAPPPPPPLHERIARVTRTPNGGRVDVRFAPRVREHDKREGASGDVLHGPAVPSKYFEATLAASMPT